MRRAIDLAKMSVHTDNGGPFGVVIVKDGQIVGEGSNSVTSTNDPTAHAEIVAIRNACKNLGTWQLDGCTIYSSCEPCPMCLGAIYWARPKKVFIACNRKDAAEVGFDDDFIYNEINMPIFSRRYNLTQLLRDEALEAFKLWRDKENKELY